MNKVGIPGSLVSVRTVSLVLVAVSCFLSTLHAEPEAGRARVVLFEPAAQGADATLISALRAVADSMELSLACLGRYDVSRRPALDPAREIGRIRSYCEENRIDQAIAGSGVARKQGGYLIRLVVYDRASDSITLERQGSSTGALDLFDMTDTLIAAMLDGLSGTHLLFGSLSVETVPPGAIVSVNGRDVGEAPVSLRGLPVGDLKITARAGGREDAEARVTIADGEVASVSLNLVRSVGKLAVIAPRDAKVTARGAGTETTEISGPDEATLPTGVYQVEAQCPGIERVSQQITVSRNETVHWLPWPDGYLDVAADVPGAQILVDGVDRGRSPQVIAVEPGTLHKVELRQERYNPYVSELRADAGSKIRVAASLALLPTTIRVETSMKGASVSLDGAQYGEAPCVFEGVQPGSHVITIDDLMVGRTYFTCGGPFKIDVQPGEQAVISKSMQAGVANVAITDAPPSSLLTVDGAPVDSRLAFTAGVDVHSGTLDLVVTSPAGQVWKNTVVAGTGRAARWSPDLLVASVPRRTVKGDGRTDDWSGLWPIWLQGPVSDKYPNQPGTRIARAYVCRDDRFLYFRIDFADGTPTLKLSPDVPTRLVYQVQVLLSMGEWLYAEMYVDRNGKATSGYGLYNSITQKATWLGGDSRYGIGDSTLELTVPMASIQRYVDGGPRDVVIYVASAAANTSWLSNMVTGVCKIDFVN
jgi:hypothetical protein